MKIRKLLVTAVLVWAIMIAGCGTESVPEINSIPVEETESARAEEASEQFSQEESSEASESATEENVTEESTTEESVLVESEEPIISELTFADLAEYQFEFSSGVGAWGEWFTIEKDGYFTGLFNDSNMGETGEGYEGGTRYSSSYSGHFTNLTKIDDYTYQMTLADISYKEPIGTEEIEDKILYVYTDSYCLGGTDTFTIYLPGTPIEALPEDVYSWIWYTNQSETELTKIIIVDETNGYGICSYDRPEPLEDAQMTYSGYKESYDYYGELLSEAATTAEMVEYSARMYELSDNCLNEIWHLIRYNVEEDKYNEILAEQRVWIEEKEAAAKEASAEYEGGSFATVAYNDTLASLTIERCEELIEYLK